MSTSLSARRVLGFVSPSPLRAYAQLVVLAETAQAFEEWAAILRDAGHPVEEKVMFKSDGTSWSVLQWAEGRVGCTCHGPHGYRLAARDDS